MTPDDLQKVLALMKDYGVTELELEGGVKIKRPLPPEVRESQQSEVERLMRQNLPAQDAFFQRAFAGTDHKR